MIKVNYKWESHLNYPPHILLSYALTVDSDSAEYTLDYKNRQTIFIIFIQSKNTWYNEITFKEIKKVIPAILPLDEENPYKTIERFNKLLVLK